MTSNGQSGISTTMTDVNRKIITTNIRGSFLMGWMPPPDGIAMCQDGDAEVT